MTKAAFAAQRTAEESVVDGYTFHAYSIANSKANLDRHELWNASFPGNNSLENDRVSCPPDEERPLHGIPGVELVVKGPREQDTDEVTGE